MSPGVTRHRNNIPRLIVHTKRVRKLVLNSYNMSTRCIGQNRAHRVQGRLNGLDKHVWWTKYRCFVLFLLIFASTNLSHSLAQCLVEDSLRMVKLCVCMCHLNNMCLGPIWVCVHLKLYHKRMSISMHPCNKGAHELALCSKPSTMFISFLGSIPNDHVSYALATLVNTLHHV